MTPNEKAIALQLEIETKLPDFVAMVRDNRTAFVVLHQDAFAADYQDQEFVLLGKAIKYAGMFGKEVRFTGRNRETVDQSPRMGHA
jgi:hypothetical protein